MATRCYNDFFIWHDITSKSDLYGVKEFQNSLKSVPLQMSAVFVDIVALGMAVAMEIICEFL